MPHRIVLRIVLSLFSLFIIMSGFSQTQSEYTVETLYTHQLEEGSFKDPILETAVMTQYGKIFSLYAPIKKDKVLTLYSNNQPTNLLISKDFIGEANFEMVIPRGEDLWMLTSEQTKNKYTLYAQKIDTLTGKITSERVRLLDHFYSDALSVGDDFLHSQNGDYTLVITEFNMNSNFEIMQGLDKQNNVYMLTLLDKNLKPVWTHTKTIDKKKAKPIYTVMNDGQVYEVVKSGKRDPKQTIDLNAITRTQKEKDVIMIDMGDTLVRSCEVLVRPDNKLFIVGVYASKKKFYPGDGYYTFIYDPTNSKIVNKRILPLPEDVLKNEVSAASLEDKFLAKAFFINEKGDYVLLAERTALTMSSTNQPYYIHYAKGIICMVFDSDGILKKQYYIPKYEGATNSVSDKVSFQYLYKDEVFYFIYNENRGNFPEYTGKWFVVNGPQTTNGIPVVVRLDFNGNVTREVLFPDVKNFFLCPGASNSYSYKATVLVYEQGKTVNVAVVRLK